ncbi:MAG: AAA family ATPase [Lentisphaeria bacterium]|nr:AAA family ATPase [Lentisphaeria bacterium]
MNERFVPFNGSGKRKAQSEVIQGILRSRDRFTLLRGVADSGKISTLKELTRGLKGNPLLLAPTNSAVEVLKQDGVPNSQTVASFLLNPPQFNGLLIVDESILNSLRDSVALLNLAENR